MDTTDRPGRLALNCDPMERSTRRVRIAIAEHCADRIPPELVADLQLVASELVTNALEHGSRGVVSIDVTVEERAATVTVTSTGSSPGIPHPSMWEFPDATQSTGRGLALTRAMSRSVEVHTAVATLWPDWVAITASIGPDATPPAPGCRTAA